MIDGPTKTHYDLLAELASPIAEAAAAVEESERQELIDQECGDESLLKSLVLGMVAELDRAHDRREQAVLDTDQVGPYRLVRELGRGGMGVVYLAERTDGLLDQQVAIKALQLGKHGDFTERFDQERRILGALDHPGIARLLDAGSTPRGLPYIVMERVDGHAIDLYCREQGLSISDRLKLLVQVCEAVEAAHRALIVHRDLKPSNILVTPSGQPKLLDFGIAKLLEPDPMGSQHSTLRMMTPDWASPEQIQGLPTTVQSDIYQLGLLMHELLTGGPPYRLTGLSPAMRAVAICDQEPRSLSSTVRALSTTKKERLASELQLTVSRLPATLSGDLDAIALKALQKEPDRRYESVGQLRRDLERYLEQLPVSARLPTVSYRLSRFVLRHRWSVLVAATAVIALVVVSAVAFVRVAEERDIAHREARRAEQREQEARAAMDFLGELMRSADPHRRGEVDEPTLRQALERGLKNLEGGWKGTPRVRARVLSELAKTFASLGDTHRAITLGSEAVELLQTSPDASPLDLAAAAELVGSSYRMEAEYADARRYLTRALRTYRAVSIPPPPEIAKVLGQLAILSDIEGDLPQAGIYFDEALAVVEQIEDGPLISLKAKILSNVGIFNKNLGADLGTEGAFEKSEQAFRRSLELMRRHPELESSIPLTLVNLGNLQHEMGRLEDARKSLQDGLDGLTRWVGDRHPQVAVAASNLGRTLTDLGRFDEAEVVLRQALEIRREVYGSMHPRVAVVISRLATVERLRGRPEQALPLYQQAHDIRRRVFDPGHPEIGNSLRQLAGCLIDLGRLDQAAEVLEEAIDILDAAGRGPDAEKARSMLRGLDRSRLLG